MSSIKNKIAKITPNFVLEKYREVKKNRKVSIYKHQNNHKLTENIKKVSVVIPNYNYENFIEERIDSICFQTYPIHELIILDDCSTDNSLAVIENKIKELKDIKVKIIANKKNSGCIFEQWKKAFTESSGDYVWIAEADDSCNHKFLEELMKAFDDEDVVISYSESMRIDEENRIISPSTRDWMTAISTTYWNKSYIHEGIDEIRNCLSVCNTIPNVSGVVFKRKNQVEILEEAKRFRISGDWFIYFSLLKNGKIAYQAKSLNYFRKHSKSASTVTNKKTELMELLTIQKEIRDYAKLDSNQIFKQSYRYGNLLNSVDEDIKKEVSPLIAKKIAWIIPYPIKGSGGIRTMVQNANYLVSLGYECDIYVEEDYVSDSASVRRKIVDYYGECLCGTYVGISFRKNYDLVFATYSILTADYVYYCDIPKKAYFIQDYEPWFEPVGGLYLEMEKTYKYGLQGVSIGKWLTHKLSTECKTPMNYFNFCADLKVYKPLKDVEKENAICYIFQPEKSRRCSNIGLKALLLVRKLRPDVKIYLYGSDVDIDPSWGMENLKIIKIDKCNELYNKCKVGLCISASNPSRIPFEMMAAGLPVVDVYRENNLYDIPDKGVLLADTTPESLATALIKILDDTKLQKSMSKFGMDFMKDYPLEKGYEQFAKFVESYLDDTLISDNKVEKTYNGSPVYATEEVLKEMDVIKVNPVAIKNTSSKVRFLIKLKRFIRFKFSQFIVWLFRI